ncbi:hypothetical protein NXV14_10575 [Bacteroides fragilis]|nr:hypothetical protein [Bacteroides fragilis]
MSGATHFFKEAAFYRFRYGLLYVSLATGPISPDICVLQPGLRGGMGLGSRDFGWEMED